MLSSRNIILCVFACAGIAAIVMACGTDESKFKDPGPTQGTFGDGGFGDAAGQTGPDLYKNDPLPKWCGPDGGGSAPVIGGTEECPEDKNKPGCGCDKPGDTAACWTGLRRHRGLGICKDGVATCKVKNETLNVWGDCEGQVLPKPDGKGGEACSCFSLGTWKIANTSPCLYCQGGQCRSYSTVGDNGGGCDFNNPVADGTKPAGDWSTDTLKVDCAGEYDLCFRIRSGSYENPSSNDCILGESCIKANYLQPDVEQPLPNLPTWFGADKACATKWEVTTPEDKSPGYGEMIVKGQTVLCEAVDDGSGKEYVFHRVKYCPRICRPGYPNYQPNHPECVDCQLKGKGDF